MSSCSPISPNGPSCLTGSFLSPNQESKYARTDANQETHLTTTTQINVIFTEREHELTFTFGICCRPSVCRLFVALVRATQPVKIFGNVSTPFGTLAIRLLTTENFTEIVPRGTPPSGSLNARRVAKYSDFGSIEGYV